MAVAYVREAPSGEVADAAPLPVWPLSVSKYDEMIESGILTEEDRVELLEGLLVPQMSKNTPQSGSTALMARLLRTIAAVGWHVRLQDPLILEDSEPEPDIALVRGVEEEYLRRKPHARDTSLIVEVADSSLERDRGIKLGIYARAGIPSYWIINLRNSQVECYSEPHGSRYGCCNIYTGIMPVSVEGASGEIDLGVFWNPRPESIASPSQ